jgi:hypothetical protein
MLLAALVLGVLGAGADMPERGRYAVTEGARYWVSRFALEYDRPAAGLPELRELEAIDFALGRASDGYVGPRRGGQNVWFRLDQMANQPAVLVYASALRELAEQIAAELVARGEVGAFVAPHPEDIDRATGLDRRPARQDALRLVVYLAR